MNNFVDGESRIRDLHRNFLANFPQLDENSEVPDFVEDDADQDMREDEVRSNKHKDSDEIEKKLKESIDELRWMDLTDCRITTDNEHTCIETLKLLDKAESFDLKGHVLKELRKVSGKKMKTLLQITGYKQSHA